MRQRISSAIIDIAKRHAALNLDTPLLIPKVINSEYSLIVQSNLPTQSHSMLMDEMGTLLMLPHDLTLPFARYIARNKITNMRRYNFARTYRYQLSTFPFLDAMH